MTRLIRALLLALIVVITAVSPLTGLALVVREPLKSDPIIPPEEPSSKWWDQASSSLKSLW